MNELKKLTSQTAREYRRLSGSKAKGNVLDVFTAQTGYTRKYAITVLNHEGTSVSAAIDGKPVTFKAKRGSRSHRKRQKTYGLDVQAALVKIWKTFNWQCSARLKTFLTENVDTICVSDESAFVTAETRRKLKQISARQIDRLLEKPRKRLFLRGTCGTKPSNRYSRLIPTMTHFDCSAQTKPGFLQIDLVQHDGGNASGEFCYTLTMTDIATGWTMHYSMKNKAHKWIKQGLEAVRQTLPFPLWHIHSDSGSEFLNAAVYNWAREHIIEFTKTRKGRKNDNCFVEQKNRSTVRDVVGYGRYEGDAATAALNAHWRLYDSLSNLFYPCFRLESKERRGSKVTKRYGPAKTPFQRVLESKQVRKAKKSALIALKAKTRLMPLQRATAKASDAVLAFAHRNP